MSTTRYLPPWSSGAFVTRTLPPPPDRPTEFEELVYAVGLEKRSDLWQYNSRLRRFAKRNRNTRYVPEKFLKQLGLEVDAA